MDELLNMNQYVTSYTMETEVQDIHLCVNITKKELNCLKTDETSCGAVIMTIIATNGEDTLSLNCVDLVRSKNLETC